MKQSQITDINKMMEGRTGLPKEPYQSREEAKLIDKIKEIPIHVYIPRVPNILKNMPSCKIVNLDSCDTLSKAVLEQATFNNGSLGLSSINKPSTKIELGRPFEIDTSYIVDSITVTPLENPKKILGKAPIGRTQEQHNNIMKLNKGRSW